jgi:hypothetical protein
MVLVMGYDTQLNALRLRAPITHLMKLLVSGQLFICIWYLYLVTGSARSGLVFVPVYLWPGLVFVPGQLSVLGQQICRDLLGVDDGGLCCPQT